MKRVTTLAISVALLVLAGASCGPELLARNLFTLLVSPADVTILQGGQTTVTVTMKRGFLVDQDITLTVEGPPSGVTFRFDPDNPQQGPENTTKSTQLTLTVAATVPLGSYQLTVKGTIFEAYPDGTATSDEQTQILILKVVGEGTGVTLMVSTDGEGIVTSNPPGINCFGHGEPGSDCTETYPGGTTVILTATPIENFQFWANCGEDNAGADGNVCGVVMHQDRGVFARFISVPGGSDRPKSEDKEARNENANGKTSDLQK